MELYTVGHSTQSQEDFIEMLMAYNINCIIDVRSMPYSRHASQFNQDILKTLLNKNNILYAHFGKEFGARRSDCLTTIQSKDGEKGKIEIEYYSQDELDRITELLMNVE